MAGNTKRITAAASPKTIHFSRAFPACAVASALVIVFGIVGLFVRGIDFGIDFVPGHIEEVRIAPPAIDLTYEGDAAITVSTSNDSISVVITSTSSDAESREFLYSQYPTVSDVAGALGALDGVTAAVREGGALSSYGIYLDNSASSTLSGTALHVYASDPAHNISVDEVRDALSALDVEVKELGTEDTRSFQIRMAQADDSETPQVLQERIAEPLRTAFGADNVATIRSDHVSSGFSSSNVWRSVVLALVTLLGIWLYATIRFHWDFALGAIIALIHDCLIMFTFIAWAQTEFSATTFAAVLTIFGYSINATVVILDRVRGNMKTMDVKSFNEILDASLSETLSRSIITTVTTLFASVALLIFTTGSIKDFAVVLTVGLVSGCYSSIFISSGFISFMRRRWVPSNGERVGSRARKSGYPAPQGAGA